MMVEWNAATRTAPEEPVDSPVMAKQSKRKASTGERAAREERKKERRAERKAAREAHRRARRRRRRIRDGVIVAVLLGAVGTVVFLLVRPDPEVEGVEKLSSEGRDHLASGATFDYGDPAPTSGPHDPRSPSCGAASQPMPLTLAVHGLEHGAVVLWYRPDAADDVRDELVDLMDGYDSHVIVSPNPDIEDPIVATAWNRRMRFDDPEAPLLAEFVDTYRNRGPENVDCPI